MSLAPVTSAVSPSTAEPVRLRSNPNPSIVGGPVRADRTIEEPSSQMFLAVLLRSLEDLTSRNERDRNESIILLTDLNGEWAAHRKFLIAQSGLEGVGITDDYFIERVRPLCEAAKRGDLMPLTDHTDSQAANERLREFFGCTSKTDLTEIGAGKGRSSTMALIRFTQILNGYMKNAND